MNLKKASAEDKVNVCRKYFIAGIPLLPWVWLVNVAWFWREAAKPDHIPQVSETFPKLGAHFVSNLVSTFILQFQYFTFLHSNHPPTSNPQHLTPHPHPGEAVRATVSPRGSSLPECYHSLGHCVPD